MTRNFNNAWKLFIFNNEMTEVIHEGDCTYKEMMSFIQMYDYTPYQNNDDHLINIEVHEYGQVMKAEFITCQGEFHYIWFYTGSDKEFYTEVKWEPEHIEDEPTYYCELCYDHHTAEELKNLKH